MIGVDIIKCPRCYTRTLVEKTIDKSDFVIRFRKCTNKKCAYKFRTKELESSDWQYKNIVKQIKDMLREVRC